ncbi:MAG TPA: ADOP family duplicated permease [Acidobacteriota bacterium]|nr:ADOP family duplicated permease [Acidobacteriota bacterium]
MSDTPRHPAKEAERGLQDISPLSETSGDDRGSDSTAHEKNADPPRLARLLVRFVMPEEGAGFLADLNAAFRRRVAKHGLRRARFRYWKEALSPSLFRLSMLLRRRAKWRTSQSDPKLSTLKEWTMTFIKDLSLALRGLLREPVLATFALLSLTLAIGANTAVFSIVHPLLLKPLDLPEAERLVRLWEKAGPHSGWALSAPNLIDWREQSDVFEGLAGYTFPEKYNLSLEGRPEVLQGIRMEPEIAGVLRIEPLLGRFFRPDEGQPGRDKVVLLSHGLWQRLYGGRESVLGETLRLDGEPYEIVGVTAPEFRWPPRSRTEIYKPLSMPEDARRNSHWLNAIARLEPGVTLEQADQQILAIAKRIEEEEPHPFGERGVLIRPLHAALVAHSRDGLRTLWAAVGLILLIGCANVANLLLARGIRRRSELAIRAALGASRGQLFRLMTLEGMILALAGGTLGVLLCLWLTPYLTRLPGSGMTAEQAGRLSLPVLGFSLFVSLATALAASLLPALRASRAQPGSALSQRRGGQGEGLARDWLRPGLVVLEVALAVVVLTAGGLLAKSYLRLTQVDPGLETQSVLTAALPLNGPDYDEEPERLEFYRRLLEEAESIPGVRQAGLISLLPVRQWGVSSRVHLIDPEGQWTEGNLPTELRVVGGQYFQAVGVELLAGRLLEPEESTRAVLVNQAFARHFLQGQNPVGGHIAANRSTPPEDWLPIVGMVADVRNVGLQLDPRPEFYMPLSMQGGVDMHLVLSADVDPEGLSNVLRQRVLAIDPRQPLAQVSVMSEVVQLSIADQRFKTLMMGLSAAVALIIALAGVYSVLSFTIGRKVYEIAVRSALGARRRHIYGLVLRSGIGPSGLGILLGLAASFWLSRWLASQLYSVQPFDLTVFGSVALLMLAVAAAATFLPARRAARVDPAVSLRAT